MFVLSGMTEKTVTNYSYCMVISPKEEGDCSAGTLQKTETSWSSLLTLTLRGYFGSDVFSSITGMTD